jgi:hypothetical protein
MKMVNIKVINNKVINNLSKSKWFLIERSSAEWLAEELATIQSNLFHQHKIENEDLNELLNYIRTWDYQNADGSNPDKPVPSSLFKRLK